MRPSPGTEKLKAFNEELRRAIEAARKAKKKFDDEKRRREDRERRESRRGSLDDLRRVWVPGSGDAGVMVELGDTHGDTKGNPNDCKKPRTNDAFSHLQYLTCRCGKGDTGACKAASALQAQQKRNSGGGGGGGF